MAVLLSEIQWSDPVLPAAPDAAWESELKRRGAPVLEVDRRVAASRWLRGSMPPTTFGMLRAAKLGLPGSSRSGL